MKHEDLAAAKRRNTIAGLVESMRAAQRQERLQEFDYPRHVIPHQRRKDVGVWKGGCR